MNTSEEIPAVLSRIEADISEIKRRLNTPLDPPKVRLLTLRETAIFLNKSEPTIYRLVSKRLIPFHKQGNKLYFIESELLEWVKSGRKNNLPGHGKR
jgi:excisionase family DNA binding protein